ncbi:IS6 family transposase [Natronococcus wangiae]|uniref:IS6 family transposase n=1 Tax=Natronococcus wangiae TaxID=3068275 RepID=UPI00273EDA35|nr:IS6 family transposase [Natronococcus sp. AD5]
MQAQEPLTVTLEPDSLECWAEESTASAPRALAVRFHASGLSLRETAAALETFGVTRSHQAVFQWVHRVAEEAPDPPTETPSRVAVDETAVTIGTEQHWLYAAIDVETKLLLDVWISPRRGANPAAEFLCQLAEKHDLSEATFLVDGMGYLTALARCNLCGHLDYVDRNLIEKWFQTLAMRIDRFHQTWIGRRAIAGRWLTAFVHYYNRQRPNQALNNRTPAEEVMGR